VLTGLGLGIALAGAPGPVQAILLAEALRGGVPRGVKAMAGANVTFGILLIALALGVSFAEPNGTVLRVLKLLGGAFIAFLGVDGLRNASKPPATSSSRELPPTLRGVFGVLLNPPAWLFLATAASSLFASATQTGGRTAALLAAIALLVGVASGDLTLVLAGGLGLRRARASVGISVRRALSFILILLGASLIIAGVMG
jgi:threonine/homoserine/homoserine lactone efflux protein